MRIAIVNWHGRILGGAEEYLSSIMTDLSASGHDLAFWCSIDEPNTFRPVPLPGTEKWCAKQLGERESLAGLRDWSPDIIYANGVENPQSEGEILRIAPAVFIAQSYYGTCISGSKTTKFPIVRACDRRFGATCLINFYPRRCGGLNPLTMWRDYQRQKNRLSLLSRYGAIVTTSRHMADEYIKHGFDPEQVHHLPWIPSSCAPVLSTEPSLNGDSIRDPTRDNEIRLMFLSRMDYLKGGRVLCAALPLVAEKLRRSIHVTFAGDGPDRQELKARAARLNGGNGLRFDFPGWVSPEKREELFQRSHLLIVPSLWPEPGGFVGLEACLRSLPVVAFDSGGIKEWLRDGVNGFLASSAPPTADGLAAAIVKVFQNPATYPRLREGASTVATSFSREAHLEGLLAVFRQVVKDAQ